jgi:hypothetical protein
MRLYMDTRERMELRRIPRLRCGAVPTMTRSVRTSVETALRSIAASDRRAIETTIALNDALRRHMAAKARLHRLQPGRTEYVQVRSQVDELRRAVLDAEQALRERPWTEV